jgi:hypothetical protein
MSQFALLLKQLWLTLRSNPVFVAAYTAALGAIASYLQGALSSGNFAIDKINWAQMGTLAAAAATAAVVHLYVPPPGTNPTK